MRDTEKPVPGLEVNAGTLLNKFRWAGKTKAERLEVGRALTAARLKKRAKKTRVGK